MKKSDRLQSKADQLRAEADCVKFIRGKPDLIHIKELEAQAVERSAKAHADAKQ